MQISNAHPRYLNLSHKLGLSLRGRRGEGGVVQYFKTTHIGYSISNYKFTPSMRGKEERKGILEQVGSQIARIGS